MKRTRVRYDRIAALVLSAALLVPLVRGLAGTGANAGERGERTYTVRAGDTLWEIAEGLDDSGDPRQTIYDIARLNGLEGGDIVPGQVLQLP